jgi:putative FmdB family regulatory protein
MPTYEYRCQDCGEHVEVVQTFTDEPLTTCGVCGGNLRKVFSPVGVVFKGSGFYKTDNRSSRSGRAGSSESSKEKSESSKEKSESSKEKSESSKPSSSSSSDGGGSSVAEAKTA